MQKSVLFLSLFSLSVLAQPKTPEGFTQTRFAGYPEIKSLTGLSVSPDGVVYAAQDLNAAWGKEANCGSVTRMEDTDGDGKADKFTQFVADIDQPRGIHFINDTLYVINPPYLTAFKDTDNDGVADQKKNLLTGIGFSLDWRGGDHTSNGVRMGVDGWLYMAIGDYSIPNGKGTDGSSVKLWGGGVLRCRPDGSELEIFTSNTRNIYGVAITPQMELFSRDNTNDGGGWNVRFHYFSQFMDAGYPRKYLSNPDETQAPLADYGGGSGTGMRFIQEPGIPKQWNNKVYSCDWGGTGISIHAMKRFEETYIIEQKTFFKPDKAMDIDADAAGNIYVINWKGGNNYAKFDKERGSIFKLKPTNHQAKNFPELKKQSIEQLINNLNSDSENLRLTSQRELISRKADIKTAKQLTTYIQNPAKTLYGRTTALFALKQIFGTQAHAALKSFTKDKDLRENALKALTDRSTQVKGLDPKFFINFLKDPNARVRSQAIISLGRLKAPGTSKYIIALGTQNYDYKSDQVPERAQLNARIPHTVFRVLLELADVPYLLSIAKGQGSQSEMALRVLKNIYTQEVADGIIALCDNAAPEELPRYLPTLFRLYYMEDIEKVEWRQHWWSTRPQTKIPYMRKDLWAGSDAVKVSIENNMSRLQDQQIVSMLSSLQSVGIQRRDFKLGLKMTGLEALVTKDKLDQKDIAFIEAEMKEGKDQAQVVLDAWNKLNDHLDIHPKEVRLALFSIVEQNLQHKKNKALDAQVKAFMTDPNYLLSDERAMFQAFNQKKGWGTMVYYSRYLLNLQSMPLIKEKTKKKIVAAISKEISKGQIHTAEYAVNMGYPEYFEEVKKYAAKGKGKKGGFYKKLVVKIEQLKNTDSHQKIAQLDKKIVLAKIKTIKGDISLGEQLYARAGCIACHARSESEMAKGPYMGNVGTTFTRDAIAEAIIDPNATISQGFTSVLFKMKDGSSHTGFVSSREHGQIALRNLFGITTKIAHEEVVSETKLKTSMMPEGLVNNLSVNEFAALVDYLSSLKK
jgi:putative membrane-bound dehydrogenase-like protein